MIKYDTNYVFKKTNQNLNIKLINTNEIDGFTISVPVIVGKSDLGTVWLYQENDGDNDFVFSVEYKTKFNTMHTHWHPQNHIDAIQDLTLFMNNDIKIRKLLGQN